MPDSLTDSLTTLKDRATHYSAPYKYKSGPLVTQKCNDWNLNKYDENFIGNQNEYFEKNKNPIQIDQFLPPTVTQITSFSHQSFREKEMWQT